MMRVAIAMSLIFVLLPAELLLAQQTEPDAPERILVTFADPGMSNAARPGPNRPGYSRRTSAYLVSITVKRAARSIAAEFGLEMVDEWPIEPLKVFCQVYTVIGDRSVETLLEELRTRPEVESAQRLNRFEVSRNPDNATADPYALLQGNLQILELQQAHLWSRGDGSTISVIDTGADINHPDLSSQIREHRDFAKNAGDFDHDAHGTAVAGLIGASSGNGFGIAGVAPSARIDVLRACWYATSGQRAICDSFTLAMALSYAIDSDTDIINLSLGGPTDPLLGRLVGVALHRGIVVVAAAQDTQTPGFPTDVPGVIVVGSSNSTNEFNGQSAMLRAPGDDILVPVPGGGFDYASGSSLSAAQVSGIVALLTAQQPDISNFDVRRILTESQSAADRSVNACKALARLLSVTGCGETETVARKRLTD